MNARKESKRNRLPSFTEEGVLPVGDYELTLDELRESALVLGPHKGVRSDHWDADCRRSLVDNLSILVRQLWQIGITEIFVGGSFVEDKDHPNDIDGYFECSFEDIKSGRLQHELNALDPYKVWTWSDASRKKVPGSSKPQLPMWRRYRVELFPHFGQLSGIRDRHGNEMEFPAAFRLSRLWIPKGIIKIVRDG